jgi:hypothetical protein
VLEEEEEEEEVCLKQCRFGRVMTIFNLVPEVSKFFIQTPNLLISNFSPLKLD